MLILRLVGFLHIAAHDFAVEDPFRGPGDG